MLGLAVVLALIRDLVPRIRAYSQFATEVAADRLVTLSRSLGDARRRWATTGLGGAVGPSKEPHSGAGPWGGRDHGPR